MPEILTCSELVATDLHDLTVKYIPGSHLIRVNDLKFARKAVDWYETGRNIYWLGSAFLNPVKTAAQFAATKVGMQTPFQHVRNNMLHWFYSTYLRELGRHLIELNSGRLKVGAKRYRELIAAHLDPARSAPVDATSDTVPSSATAPEPVSLAIVGQVKAGKSSLVNALLGDQRASRVRHAGNGRGDAVSPAFGRHPAAHDRRFGGLRRSGCDGSRSGLPP